MEKVENLTADLLILGIGGFIIGGGIVVLYEVLNNPQGVQKVIETTGTIISNSWSAVTFVPEASWAISWGFVDLATHNYVDLLIRTAQAYSVGNIVYDPYPKFTDSKFDLHVDAIFAERYHWHNTDNYNDIQMFFLSGLPLYNYQSTIYKFRSEETKGIEYSIRKKYAGYGMDYYVNSTGSRYTKSYYAFINKDILLEDNLITVTEDYILSVINSYNTNSSIEPQRIMKYFFFSTFKMRRAMFNDFPALQSGDDEVTMEKLIEQCEFFNKTKFNSFELITLYRDMLLEKAIMIKKERGTNWEKNSMAKYFHPYENYLIETVI